MGDTDEELSWYIKQLIQNKFNKENVYMSFSMDFLEAEERSIRLCIR